MADTVTLKRGNTFACTFTWTPGPSGPATLTSTTLASSVKDACDNEYALGVTKALDGFRSLKAAAANSRPLAINIALLCEMLARPFEASEAWLTVAESAADHARVLELNGELREIVDEREVLELEWLEAAEVVG